eukprot:INCI10570.1.p1 GENE.INCI10570.1~~INCI10570.1.p1  ORF type:complete len:218 (+),score=37.97 INCI10570.1:462-1115(+)
MPSATTHGISEEEKSSLEADLLDGSSDGFSSPSFGVGPAAAVALRNGVDERRTAGDEDGRGENEDEVPDEEETYLDADGRVRRIQSPMTIDWQHMRTSLANERTFLAWTRTAMSIFSFGWAILKVQQYFTVNQLHWYDEVVGYLFCLSGCLVMVIGTQRYLRVRSAMAFPESVVRFGRFGIRYVVAMVGVCLVVALLRVAVNDVESHYVPTNSVHEL